MKRGHEDVSELRRALPGELLPAGVGVLLLLVIQALNVYKPQGMTAYGRPRVARAALHLRSTGDAKHEPGLAAGIGKPRWVQIVGIHAVGLALLFAVFHLIDGGAGSH